MKKIVVLAALAMAFGCASRTVPNLSEVLERGKRHGLVVVSPREDGNVLQSAVLSTHPMRWQEAAQLPADGFDSHRWAGHVIVTVQPGYTVGIPEKNLLVVGSCHVWGDAAVVEMLRNE